MKVLISFLSCIIILTVMMMPHAGTAQTVAAIPVANVKRVDTTKAASPKTPATSPRTSVGVPAATNATAPATPGSAATPARTFKRTVVIDREIFQYTATGRRDPFVSLLTSDELRPLLSDLRLTTIAHDPSGRSSVAVLRDLETKQQYRIVRGAQLGRMRVVRIDQKSVTFVIEEYGFSRQETLTMSDTSTTTSR